MNSLANVHAAVAADPEARRLRNEIAIIRMCLETGEFTKALLLARIAAPRTPEEILRGHSLVTPSLDTAIKGCQK